MYARLANVTVTAGVASFRAMLDINTTEFFDGTKGADFTLRYQSGNTLVRGDVITVSATPLVPADTELQVCEKPQILADGHEFVAQLVRAA